MPRHTVQWFPNFQINTPTFLRFRSMGLLVVESTVSTHLGQTVTTPILNDAGTMDNPTAGTYYSALGSHFLDDQAANVAAGPDAFGSISGTIATPEPASLSLFAVSAAGLLLLHRRRQKLS